VQPKHDFAATALRQENYWAHQAAPQIQPRTTYGLNAVGPRCQERSLCHTVPQQNRPYYGSTTRQTHSTTAVMIVSYGTTWQLAPQEYKLSTDNATCARVHRLSTVNVAYGWLTASTTCEVQRILANTQAICWSQTLRSRHKQKRVSSKSEQKAGISSLKEHTLCKQKQL
jgi:hypothetical protein